MVVKHAEGSRSTSPDSVVQSKRETRIKSELKMESVTKRQVQTWSLFLYCSENIHLTLSTPHFRASQQVTKRWANVTPSSCTEPTAWMLESAATEPGTHPLGADNRSQTSSFSTSFSAAHLHMLSKRKPPLSAGCLPTALPVILIVLSFYSSQAPTIKYFNILELQVKSTWRKSIPTSTVPSFQTSGLYCSVISPVHPTAKRQTPVLHTGWCSRQAFSTSTLFRCPYLLSFDCSLLYDNPGKLPQPFPYGSKAEKNILLNCATFISFLAHQHKKSYPWLIQRYPRIFNAVKIFLAQKQKKKKKIEVFQHLAPFATIVEKVLSKQVYPWDHCFVMYINSSINHKAIFKDLPETEK